MESEIYDIVEGNQPYQPEQDHLTQMNIQHMLNEMSIQSQFQQMQQQAKEKSSSKHISTKSMNAFVALTNQKKQSAVVQKIVAQQPG